MLDAYTIKKVLPRLVFAIIAVNLSFLFCKTLLNFSNDIGSSVSEILLNAFNVQGQFHTAPTTITDNIQELANGEQLAIMGIAAGIGFSSWPLILPALLTGAFALLTGFLVVTVRQLLIIIMVMISPLAIALWVLPGTEQWAKKWWNFYVKLLLMFPVIMLFLDSGIILSEVAGNAAQAPNADEGTKVVFSLIAILSRVIPYFMIAFAIKFVGGALTAIGGLVNRADKGLVDRSRNWGQEKKDNTLGALRRRDLKDQRSSYKKQRAGIEAAGVLAGRANSRSPFRRAGRLSGMSQDDFEVQQFKADQLAQEHANRTINIKAEIDKKAVEDAFKNLEAEIKLRPDQGTRLIEESLKKAADSGDTAGIQAALTMAAKNSDITAAHNMQTYVSTLDGPTGDAARVAWANATNANYGDLSGMSPSLTYTTTTQIDKATLNAKRLEKFEGATPEAVASMKGEAWDLFATLSAPAPTVYNAKLADVTSNETLRGKKKAASTLKERDIT